MSADAPRFLFLPVTSARGAGELARCLTIARGVRDRWPEADIHFAASSASPQARALPFATTLLPGSPTLHTPEVVALLRDLRPHVVVFDNSGRTAQLRAAALLGCRVVYVSARRRQRAKAFRWRWMRLIDEHWIAYPERLAGSPGWRERLKLAVLRRPRLRYFDAFVPEVAAGAMEAVRRQHRVEAGDFVLVVPGGGAGHPGAEDAPAVFADTATRLAERELRVVLIGCGGDRAGGDRLSAAPWVAAEDLAALMGCARVVVTNGGGTLMQALALGRACVAAPIARDQRRRLRRVRDAGWARVVKLDSAELASAAAEVCGEPRSADALDRAVRAAGLRNGVEAAVAALEALVGEPV